MVTHGGLAQLQIHRGFERGFNTLSKFRRERSDALADLGAI